MKLNLFRSLPKTWPVNRLAGVQHTREVAEAYKHCLKDNCGSYKEQILNLDLRIFPVIKEYQGG